MHIIREKSRFGTFISTGKKTRNKDLKGVKVLLSLSLLSSFKSVFRKEYADLIFSFTE